VKEQLPATKTLSPWWRRSVVLVFVFGMAVLIFMSVQAYRYAPPIPESVVDSAGKVIFNRQDIESGQQVFLKYALMQNGSIWGHGSYLGPDFSAAYLHELAVDTGNAIARQEFNTDLSALNEAQRSRIETRVAKLLKENRYDPSSSQLKFLDAEKASYQRQRQFWTDYFLQPTTNAGLPSKYIHDPEEIRQLTAFFAWTAWASVANRPDKPYSYTNNFPYDPMVGNLLTADSLLWSALSVAMLLAGLALVLFTFGRFDYLGWKGDLRDIHPTCCPVESRPARWRPSSIFSLWRCSSWHKSQSVARWRITVQNPVIFMASTWPNICRAIFCARGTFSWRSFGSPPLTSPAVYCSLLRWAKRSRAGTQWAFTCCLGRWSCWWSAACWVNCSAFTKSSAKCGPGLDIRVGNFLNWGGFGRSFWSSDSASGYGCYTGPSRRP